MEFSTYLAILRKFFQQLRFTAQTLLPLYHECNDTLRNCHFLISKFEFGPVRRDLRQTGACLIALPDLLF